MSILPHIRKRYDSEGKTLAREHDGDDNDEDQLNLRRESDKIIGETLLILTLISEKSVFVFILLNEYKYTEMLFF